MIYATGAQIIVKLLENQGVRFVSGIPGSSVLPLYDELSKSSIQNILVRHEQGGGFIAQGIARSTGEAGVCIATSGPGAMNLLTAVADARADSIPMVAITGQVNICQIGTDAFQEVDTFGLSLPITKHSIMVKTARELLTVIPAAFSLALSARPGPVLIDVPLDVQLENVEFESWPKPGKKLRQSARFHTPITDFPHLINEFCDNLLTAKKPVLFVGGGCNNPEASFQISSFLKIFPIPVVTSLMGIGVVSAKEPLLLGMVGKYGFPASNQAVYNADIVIAAGVRFDDRATGNVASFCPSAKILHVDIDAAEVNKILPAACSIVSDVESVFPVLIEQLQKKLAEIIKNNSVPNAKRQYNLESALAGRQRWLNQVEEFKKMSFAEAQKSPTGLFIHSIPKLAESLGFASENLIITTDVGQHQMWAAQQYPVERTRSFLTSGALGTMGFGLPAAIGAALANPSKRILCLTGDGSVFMNIQEFATLSELDLNVTVIVFENGSLGMIKQQQEALYNGNYASSVFKKNPDILEIAKGFNIRSLEAPEADSAGSVGVSKNDNWLKAAFFDKGPCVIRRFVDINEKVFESKN